MTHKSEDYKISAVKYYLENTGEKDIITDEYTHNFIAINKDLIGTNYLIKFPFQNLTFRSTN